MSIAALEINDAALLGAIDGQAQLQSPGYALLGGEPPVIGAEALRVARIEPLNVNNRFWDDLEERPMLGRMAAGRSHADLAYLHLVQVWERLRGRVDSVRCVVPPTLRPPQLALFLGMAREAQLPIEGFIDAGVAAAAAWPGSGRLLFVELYLHKAIVTAVAVGERVRRERSEVVASAGWLGFVETWMRMIGREFVRQTRFDPLHQAVTEQALFDRLPTWLEALGTQEFADVEVPFGSEIHALRLTRELFAHEAEALYSELLMRVHRLRSAGHATTIALSDRTAILPGLGARLAEFNDCGVVRCPPGVAVSAACVLGELWQGGGDTVQLLGAAPRIDAATAARFEWPVLQAARPAGEVAAPTHVLYRGQAIALAGEPLLIGLAPPDSVRALRVVGAAAGVSRIHCSLLRTAEGATVIDHSRFGTWLNDEAVVGRAQLRAGDRLRLGRPGVTLELIASE